MHPILDALDGTPHEWIKKLLFTFNEGNIGKFEALAPLFPKEVRACACAQTLLASSLYLYLCRRACLRVRLVACAFAFASEPGRGSEHATGRDKMR